MVVGATVVVVVDDVGGCDAGVLGLPANDEPTAYTVISAPASKAPNTASGAAESQSRLRRPPMNARSAPPRPRAAIFAAPVAATDSGPLGRTASRPAASTIRSRKIGMLAMPPTSTTASAPEACGPFT